MAGLVGCSIGEALKMRQLFLADDGRLRVGWRLLIFLFTFFVVSNVLGVVLIISFYVPLSGARHCIRAAKQGELERIDIDVGDHRKVLAEPDGPDRVDRLLAYRERIRAIPEWPLGLRGAPRALLYIAIPLLSWVAGAFVERWLDALLD